MFFTQAFWSFLLAYFVVTCISVHFNKSTFLISIKHDLIGEKCQCCYKKNSLKLEVLNKLNSKLQFPYQCKTFMNNRCPNLMNLSRISNPPKTGFN